MCKDTKLAGVIRGENAWRFPMSTGLLGFVLGMSCLGVAMKLLEYENSPSLPPKLVGVPVSMLKLKFDNQSTRLSVVWRRIKLNYLTWSVCRCAVKLSVFRVLITILHLMFLNLKMLGTAQSKYVFLWDNFFHERFLFAISEGLVYILFTQIVQGPNT